MAEQQKSQKGAPAPRKRRGRTENRRRERFIRKAAKKLAKKMAAGDDTNVLSAEIERSKAAQLAKVRAIVKK